eukprot:c17559_g1_i1.p1 GENE.c17559_g1_i1~~c17559_g1_i1.p1  ORF type:complete len:561 (+),score=197.58 c17559_g1_i1:107-1789(+)
MRFIVLFVILFLLVGSAISQDVYNQFDNDYVVKNSTTNDDDSCDFGSKPIEQQCDYVSNNPACDGNNFDYIKLYACASTTQRPFVILFFLLYLLILFYLLGTTADGFFCPQVEELADRLGLTPRVAGVTLLSLGNGAPDIFSGIAAIQAGQIDLVLGQVSGGGMFIVSVVVGGVLFTAGGIRTRFPVLRDMMMYLIIVAVILILIDQNALKLVTGVCLLTYYFIFVVVAYWSDKTLLRRMDSVKNTLSVEMIEPDNTTEVLNKEYRLSRVAHNFGTLLDHLSNQKDEITQQKTLKSYIATRCKQCLSWIEAPFTALRELTIINCAKDDWSVENESRIKATAAVLFTPVLIATWQGFLFEYVGPCPLAIILIACAIPFAAIFAATCPTDEPPHYSLFMILLGFFSAAIWVNLFANELVDLLSTIGRILSISEVVMGATVLAWGNCIGDLTSDILLAKNKREGTAITACFAGPMFNLLIGLGSGTIIKTISGPIQTRVETNVMISFSFLIGTVFLMLVIAFGVGKCSAKSGNRLPKVVAFILWFVYASYFFTMIIYEIVSKS